jgi:DNA-binding transcriptional LysR family regulator
MPTHGSRCRSSSRGRTHDQQSVVAGKLRLTAPSAFATYLIPVVSEFLQKHPAIAIDLVFDDAMIDLIDARIDIALRVGGGNTEATFVSRRIAMVALLVVAAPSYLAIHGQPRVARDLTRFEWLHSAAGSTNQLTLRKGKSSFVVQQQGRLSCNSGPSNLAAAVAGHGVMMVPDFEVARELKAGTLVRVLPNWTIEERALSLVFPPRRHVLGRVRAMADFLAKKFRNPTWET